MPRRIIQRREAATGDAEQVKRIELQIIGESVQIVGDAARLWPGRRIGHALAPAPAVEGDDAVAIELGLVAPLQVRLRGIPAFGQHGLELLRQRFRGAARREARRIQPRGHLRRLELIEAHSR